MCLCRLELCGSSILLYHNLVDAYRKKVAQSTVGADGEKSGSTPTTFLSSRIAQLLLFMQPSF